MQYFSLVITKEKANWLGQWGGCLSNLQNRKNAVIFKDIHKAKFKSPGKLLGFPIWTSFRLLGGIAKFMLTSCCIVAVVKYNLEEWVSWTFWTSLQRVYISSFFAVTRCFIPGVCAINIQQDRKDQDDTFTQREAKKNHIDITKSGVEDVVWELMGVQPGQCGLKQVTQILPEPLHSFSSAEHC